MGGFIVAVVKRGLPILIVGLLVGLFGLFTVASAQTTGNPVLTTSLAKVSASQTSALGQKGVSITYNNTLSQPVTAAVYISLQNSAGFTVYISLQVYTFQPKQVATFFFGPSGLPSGSYTARLFAAQGNGVPLSTTTTVQVSL